MTLKQQNWPLRYRILFFSLCLSFLASLIIALPVSRAAVAQLELQAMQLRNTLSQQASKQAADAIFSQDLLSLKVILSTLVEHPHMAYVAVYDLNNEIIAEQGQAIETQSQPMSIQYQNEVIGLLEIRTDESQLQQAIVRIYSLVAILSLLFSVICGALGWFIGTKLWKKISQSQLDIERLEQENLQVSLHKWGELAQLSQSIKAQGDKLHASQAMFSALNRFMTPNVNSDQSLNYDKAQLPESYAHAAILFIDFVDLQRAQQAMNPQELAALLNQYYFFIHQAARLYSGNVDKYLGDGVMVLFGIPQQDDKDCFHGSCTALLIIGLLKQYNKSRQEQSLPFIDFQLGLHTGSILAGTFGDQDNLTYTAIGDAIHVAARLSHKGAANRLLISKTVLDQGRLNNKVMLNKHKPIKDSQPDHFLETYWIDNLTPNYQALIERQIQHISVLQTNETN